MSRRYPYIVIDAPGHYGNHGTVWSRHGTLEAALLAKGSSRYAIAHNDGDYWLPADKFHRARSPEIVTNKEKK